MPTISNNSAPPSALHAAAVLTGPNLARAQLSPPIAAGGNLSGDELQGPTDSEITIGNVSPSMGGTSTGFDMGATPTSAPSGSNIVIPFGQDGPLRSEQSHGGIAVILTSNNNSISGTCTPRAVTSNNSPSGIFGSSPLPINATSVFTASPPHMRSPSSNYGAHSSAHLSTSIITAAHPPHLTSVLHSGMSPAEQVKALRQSNMVAKAELQRKDVRIKALTKAVAETVAITESHEEQIMNKLLRQVDRIKREKERLLVHKIVEENRKTKEEERLKKITAERARLSERLKAEEYLIRSRLNKQLEAVQKQRRALEGKVNAETATLQELVDAFRNYQTLEEQAAKNLMIVGWNNETSLHLGSSASSIAIGNNNTFASTASNIAPSPSHQVVNHVDPNSPPISDANAACGAAVLPVILSTVSHPHSTSPTQPWAPEKQLSGLSNSGATPHSGIAPLSSSSHHRGFHVTHTRQLSQIENESNASTSTLPGAASREPSIIAGARAPTTSSSFKAPSVLVGVSPYALGGIGGGAAPNTPQTTTSSKSGTSGQSAADPANALSDAFMIKQLQKEIRRARGLQADMRNRSAEFQQKRELLEERLFNWMNRRRRQDSGVVGGPQLQNNKGALGTNLQSEGSFGAFALRNQNQWGDGNYSGATTINTSVAATPLRGSGIFNDSATIASSAAAYAAASNGRERANTANSSNYQFVPYNPNAAMSNNNLPAGLLQVNSASPTPTHGHRSSPGGMARNSRHRNNSGFLPHAAGGNTGSPAAPSSFFGTANPNLAQGGDTTATDCSDAESNSLYAYKPASSMGGVAPTPVHGRVQPASHTNSASQRTPWRGGGGVTQNQTPFSVSTSPQSAIGQATGSQQAAAPTASEAASLLYASTQQRYQSLANHQLTSNASTSHASTSGVHAPGGSAPVALLGTSPSSQYRLASPSVTSSAQQGQASSATRQAPQNVATINVVANRHSYAASETSGRHTPYDASLMGVDTASQTPLASARSQPNVK